MSTSIKFNTKLGFIRVGVFNTRVLGTIMDAFEGEKKNCKLRIAC